MKINIGNIAWNLVNAAFLAIVAMKFPRRRMYLICTCSLICVYIGWTISSARYAITENLAVGKLSIFFIYLYSPCYNIGYNALTYSTPNANMILELVANNINSLPHRAPALFAPISRNHDLPIVRAQRLFPEVSTTCPLHMSTGTNLPTNSIFVNPIGLGNAGWKYLISYIVWLAFEITCVYFLWPETFGRTLEELTFCKY